MRVRILLSRWQSVHALCSKLKRELQNNQFDTSLIYRNQYFKKDEWDFSPNWKTKLTSLLEDYLQMNDAKKSDLDKLDWWRYLSITAVKYWTWRRSLFSRHLRCLWD